MLGNVTAPTPRSCTRCRPGRVAVGVRGHDDLGAAGAAPRPTPSAGSPTIRCGLVARRRAARRPRASTPTSTGRYSRMYLLAAARGRRVVVRRRRRPAPAGRPDRPRPSGTPTPSSSSARSRLMNSMVLAANASSWWTARPWPRPAHRRPTRRSARRPRASSAPRRRRRPRAAGSWLPSLIVCKSLGADVVDQRDARVDEDLRAEVGVAAGDRRRGVDHGGDARRRPARRRWPGRDRPGRARRCRPASPGATARRCGGRPARRR